MEQMSIRYLVTGSIATIAYGEPRFTNDIDILVELKSCQIESFCQQFSDPDFYVSKSAVSQVVAHHFQFNVIHPESGLKVDFILLSDSPFDQSRLARRRQLVVIDEGPVWFASPEDVILKKLVYYREGGSEKHLRDIAGVLKVQGAQLDREYLSQWAKTLDVAETWNQLVVATGSSD
jgi:hypothetical protein